MKMGYRGAAVFLVTVTMLVSACSSEDPMVTLGDRHYRLINQEGGLRVYEEVSGGGTLRIETPDGEWAYAVQVDDRRYLISGEARAFTVKFPDERTLTRTHSGDISSGSAPAGTITSFDDWDTVDALGILVFGAAAADPTPRSPGMVVGGIILIVYGLTSALNPRLAFFLELGWRLRNSEPTELYLAVTRTVGIIVTIVGLFLVLG